MADPILIATPDGQRYQFPAGTDDLTIKRAIDEDVRKRSAVGQGGAPSMPPEPPPERSLLQRGGDFMRDQVGWQATRALNAGTAMLGTNPVVEPVKNVLAAVAPDSVNRVMKYAYPDAQTMREVAYRATGTAPVNTPDYLGGKITDAATEAALAAPAFPGSLSRTIVPAAVGGAASEFAGQQTAGTKWETPARVVAGAAGGLAAAGVQEAGRAAYRGAKNVLAPASATEDTATRIVGRALDRDKLTPQQMLARMKDLGDEAMPVDAGGENVRGALRGSIAAPGQARTTVVNAFGDRAEKEGARVAASVDKNVSPKGLTQTVDDLIEARRKASAPAYEAAGVPNDPKAYANAPVLTGDAVTALIKDSKDVQSAIAAARRLPDYKGLPDTSMVMLDKAYKNIGGMADEAKRAGNGERFRDLESLRKSLLSAIDAENKQYAGALAAYSGPSKIKDAAELGASLFGKNARPDVVRREFSALSDEGKDAFRVGVAEHLRKVAGARDASGVAGRVMGGPDAQDRLRAVLGKDEADRILADFSREKTFTQSARAVGQGSRTTPMGLEAADNAQMAAGVAGDVARGRFGNALSRVAGRLTEGRTEAVNARVSQILTSMKPEDRTALVNALEQSILNQRLASPRNAFRAGAVAPLPGALQERR